LFDAAIALACLGTSLLHHDVVLLAICCSLLDITALALVILD
jgi:hypothetical protein